MLENYFKTAWRYLIKNKAHSLINITGLSVGMAVAMLISLWIYDELSFNKNFQHYNRIAEVWQYVHFDGDIASFNVTPIPMAEELKSKYPEIERVSLTSPAPNSILAYGDKKFSETGNYEEPAFAEMMSLEMISGNRNGLNSINSILLSQSLANRLFDKQDPINQIVKLNNKLSVKVTGIYKDLPGNSTFKDVNFIAPWNLYSSSNDFVTNSTDNWDNNSWQIYVQLKDGADFDKVSAKIKDARMRQSNPPGYKPEFFLHLMSKWHLYADFKNGKNIGGLIQFVWLFGIIGIFVLLLACINFMNLSTARSQQRAKEVGIRKAIGSMRKQLIFQFFSESLLVVAFAFVLSLVWVLLILPFFNDVADKNMSILWSNSLFWLVSLVFCLLTGLIAGSYPAIYLSSFKPIKVLKGAFRVGPFAAVPRKALVVLQFTVSVILIIGTTIVFRQIQYSKNRPIGYSYNGLIEINMNTPQLFGHYQVLRADLLNTGAVAEMSESSGSVTVQYGGTTDVSWRTKTPDLHPILMSNSVTHDYGKTVGWQLLEGRDFSRAFPTDSASMLLNEAAVTLMGFKNAIGELVQAQGKQYKVIGVIKNMVKQSPFEPVKPSFFVVNYKGVDVINIKLAPKTGTHESLARIAAVFKKYNPESPFTYKFVDEQYGKKFGNEERVGKLASFFATLAIFISCLGLFGMASFMTEQRTKEIGVRKVLGASVLNLWKLLSREFVMLVIISFLIAAPTAWYFMNNWLQKYEYRTTLSWWIFASAGVGALVITILTVSFQSIKAAIANPVKSLRME